MPRFYVSITYASRHGPSIKTKRVSSPSLAHFAVNASLHRLHDHTAISLGRLWKAVLDGYCPPPLYACAERDHPLRTFEEIERLLSSLRYFLRANLPEEHSAEERELQYI